MNKSASICIIGSELTKGIIGDKHSKMISQELSKLNINVNQISIINDDGSIEALIDAWLNFNDIIFVTGGLGPTSDDLTRSSISKVANVELVENKKAYDNLLKMVGERINGANYSQTLIPKGFNILENPFGTAVGFYGEIKKDNHSTLIYSMPGPPKELNPMFYNLVIPHLKNNIGFNDIESIEYSTFLICESKLEEACASLKFDDIKWGTRFQDNKISLFVSGKEKDEFISKLRDKVGSQLILEGNHDSLNIVIDNLKSNQYSISCAESCTGGLCSKLLTDFSGSSAFFEGSVVSYSNDVKNKILNVKKDTLEKFGAVSKETVLEMADNVRLLMNSDVAFSVSGIAGPLGGSVEKPVGTVWFGFSKKGEKSQAVCLKFTTTTRNGIRRRASVASFLLLSFYINGYTLLDIIDKWEYI